MKVLHISTGDINGGAFRGAYWLHQGLLARDVDSMLLVLNKASDDATVVNITSQPLIQKYNKLKGAVELLPSLFYKKQKGDAFSPAITSATGLQKAVQVHQPDIIHLHWINGGLLNPETLRMWTDIPVVWTLRDMWPFSGGCHYTNGCTQYTSHCGSCPVLGSQSRYDISYLLWLRKQRAWRKKHIHLVAISHWIAQCARESSLFKDRNVTVIHNAVDETVFRPLDQSFSRTVLNLPQDKKLIAFGAIDATKSERKGFSYLVQALKLLAQQSSTASTELLVFGSSKPLDSVDLGMNATYLGKLNDNVTLALVYSAADVMVVPSVQEAFGKTAIEAMACATPVVSFDSTGLKDIVIHQKTGYRAKCFEPEDLAYGINWVLEDSERYRRLSLQARLAVESRFTIKQQATHYYQLYQDILGELTA